MRYGLALFAAASAATLLASGASAQARQEAEVEELVVTGTRTEGRSRLDTLAPVDVVSAEALTRTGTTELAQSLSTVTPSINFPRPAITDGTDHVRPATLRGLAPDQTLVLVNSTRRHASALVNVNGSVGRGSAAVDLNAIPTVALETIEVLREGASAQYGSDAIAGVINLRLREAREGGGASVTYGQYNTTVKTPRNTGGRDEDDGQTVTVQGWVGLPLGAEGFVTLSGEYLQRDPTSRGDIDVRVTPPRINSRYGDPEVESWNFYANAGLPLNETWDLYGWGGYQTREGNSAANPRALAGSTLAAATALQGIYPTGFLPLIGTDIEDGTAAVGLRGEVAGFDVDMNVVWGRNEINYSGLNTGNATYGSLSPTTFDDGGMSYEQVVFGLDVARRVDVGFFEPLNVAFGLEARKEGYEIRAGEPASYNRGPITSIVINGVTTALPGGAQGFPGFQPSNVVDVERDNIGAYIDLEAQITEAFSASAAVRAEDYSDFGSTVTGKLSARYDFTPQFALRGSVSSGFRAPALQQQFFTTTSTNFINGVPVEVGTFPATSPTARVLGGQPLEPEESINYALGMIYHAGPFELTIDTYRIDIDNRIVLSENIQGNPTGTPTQQAIFALLAPFNASAARFFINGVETETWGVDLVARYRLDAEAAGRFDFTLAGNYNETDVTRVPTNTVISALPVPPVLFDRVNVLAFEKGTPRQKGVFSIDWENLGWGATFKLSYYGEVLQPATTPALDVDVGSHELIDLEGRYTFENGFALAVGANNLFDEYPNWNPVEVNTNNAIAFPSFSPFGFNGRYLYARISYNW